MWQTDDYGINRAMRRAVKNRRILYGYGSLQAVQFASVSSCARRLLKHFRCRCSCSLMRTTDVFRDISRTVVWVRAGPLDLVNVFVNFALCSVPWRLSTEPMSLKSELLEQPANVVHPLSGNSVLNCLALYPFNWYKKVLLESYVRRWKPCSQTMHWRYDVWDKTANKWLPK